jgi:hypothetical protein
LSIGQPMKSLVRQRQRSIWSSNLTTAGLVPSVLDHGNLPQLRETTRQGFPSVIGPQDSPLQRIRTLPAFDREGLETPEVLAGEPYTIQMPQFRSE